MQRMAYVFFISILFVILTNNNCCAFRCGDDVVTRGDAMGKVLMKCGEPTYKEVVKKETHGTYSGNQYGRAIITGQYTEETQLVEKWSYNCGDQDFVYVLTFKGKTMESETTDGYGTGASDCKGAKNLR